MADVVNQLLKTEDFAIEETKACEQILDNFFDISQEEVDVKPNILDTAWEETFNDFDDLFPECTF